MQNFEDIESLWPITDVPTSEIDMYSGPEVFLDEYDRAPDVQKVLFAAYWLQAELLNGGIHQFFWNDTGVLAPEAADACRTLGLSRLASAVESAMEWFGEVYPRVREVRQEALDRADDDVFDRLDDEVVELIYEENGGLEASALAALCLR